MDCSLDEAWCLAFACRLNRVLLELGTCSLVCICVCIYYYGYFLVTFLDRKQVLSVINPSPGPGASLLSHGFAF